MIISYIICTSAWRSVWLDLLVYFCCYLLIINLLSLQDISHEIWYFFGQIWCFLYLGWWEVLAIMTRRSGHQLSLQYCHQRHNLWWPEIAFEYNPIFEWPYLHHVQIYISLSCYQSFWVNKGKWKYKSSKVHCLMAWLSTFCHHNEHFFSWDFWVTRFADNFWNSANSKDAQMQPMWVYFRIR